MSIETAKMSERGQIIIPKEIREQIRADKDTLFAVSTLDNNTIVMKKIDTDSLLKQFKDMRKRTAKLSEAQINAEIRAYRKEKGSP